VGNFYKYAATMASISIIFVIAKEKESQFDDRLFSQIVKYTINPFVLGIYYSVDRVRDPHVIFSMFPVYIDRTAH